MIDDVPADQRIRLFEGRPGYHVVRPVTWTLSADSLVLGDTVELTIAVTPTLFEPGAEVVRVVADLSALGGAAETLLSASDDGTYRMTPVPLEIEGVNGFRDVSLAIEQTTSLGAYRTNLFRTIAVLPASDETVFANAAQLEQKCGG